MIHTDAETLHVLGALLSIFGGAALYAWWLLVRGRR